MKHYIVVKEIIRLHTLLAPDVFKIRDLSSPPVVSQASNSLKLKSRACAQAAAEACSDLVTAIAKLSICEKRYCGGFFVAH
jgi:hypothetical protein